MKCSSDEEEEVLTTHAPGKLRRSAPELGLGEGLQGDHRDEPAAFPYLCSFLYLILRF